MASLEHIVYQPHRCAVVEGCVKWNPVKNSRVIDGLPQIFWMDSTPWREANLWALERATTRDVNLATVGSNMTALHGYAQWLERTGRNWWDFPAKRADRCLVCYRGALIDARDCGEIAPSTASQRMAAVVQFYRWAHTSGLISPDWPMWSERIVGIHLVDPVGFHRTIAVNSTDLAIRNRKAPGDRLEDGLLPVSVKDRTLILEFAKEHASEELFLMLTIGFYTGMRLGTLGYIRFVQKTPIKEAAANAFTREFLGGIVGRKDAEHG